MEQHDAALGIAIECGLLQHCPIHEDSIIGGPNEDLEAAYKIASARFKAGDQDLKHLFSSQKELTDCIKETGGNGATRRVLVLQFARR